MRKTLLGSSIALALVTLIAGITLPGCSDDPAAPEKPEKLASIEVQVPEWVRSNTPFSITVTAVGDRGSSPHKESTGTVALSVPQGTISPPALNIVEGRGTADVSLTGVVGSITVTASIGSIFGTGTIRTVSPDSIAGGIANDVADLIPDLDYIPLAQDFSQDHPQLMGAQVAHRAIMLAFAQGTTVGEANEILDNIDGAIVGGLPGIVGMVEGVVMARLSTASHTELELIITDLKNDVRIASVFSDVAVRGARIARPNHTQQPYDWTWSSNPAGGNWGVELIRVPQMWNLNDAVAKGSQRPLVGVVDYGFPAHPDLEYFSVDAAGADHGAMVTGIIAAGFGNQIGVDGINPFADIAVENYDPVDLSGMVQHTVADNIQSYRRFVLANSTLKIVTLTSYYGWCAAGIDASSNNAAQDAAKVHGEEFKRALKYIESSGLQKPILVTASGNDSDDGCGVEDAMYASPWNNAGLDNTNPTPVEPNILVVEAVELDAAAPGGAHRALFSNTGGHVSAPGVCIRSTASQTPSLPLDPACDVDGSYKSDSGTSFAAPHVAALISYMLVVDPTLAMTDVKDLLTTRSVPVGAGGGPVAANRVDAWASVIDIDRISASDKVLRMSLDIDDGTPDGNQRIDHLGTSIDFDTHGDGTIDMSDFRRWRDWALQIEDNAGLDLDGDRLHSKKDPNGNLVASEATGRENTYPRGDFNGDGTLDTDVASYVPGVIDGLASDLEVLQSQFSDPNYDVSELPNLVQSGDVTIAPAGCLSPASPDVIANGYDVVSMATPTGQGSPIKEITHSRFAPVEVMTVPPGQYEFAVQIRDGIGVVDEETLDVTVTLGGDAFWPAGEASIGCIDTVAVRQITEIPVIGSPGNHGLSNLGDFDGDGVVDLARIGGSTRYANQRAIYLMRLNNDGTLKSETAIEAIDLGYDPDGGAPFKTVSGIGDLNRDNVIDIAVGVFDETELLGAVWILLLNADGTVQDSKKITGADLGCASCSQGGGTNWIAPLDDLNGDANPDIAVAWGNDAGSDQMVVIFLRPTGELRSAAEWGPLTSRDNPIAAVGDLDSDGNMDVAYAWNFFFSTLKATFLDRDGSEKMGAEQFSWPASETILSIGGGGDFDGDTVPDVLITTLSPLGSGSNVWVMLLNADGSLKNWLLVNHPGDFIWGATILGDIDGDTAADIAILDQSQFGSDSIFILFVTP